MQSTGPWLLTKTFLPICDKVWPVIMCPRALPYQPPYRGAGQDIRARIPHSRAGQRMTEFGKRATQTDSFIAFIRAERGGAQRGAVDSGWYDQAN